MLARASLAKRLRLRKQILVPAAVDAPSVYHGATVRAQPLPELYEIAAAAAHDVVTEDHRSL